ncbi:hypothetical protein HVIM_04199 [Roseomonas mucosa]|nr:hypothetical protein HVIM_04199 [Roseomonas mucosa]QDD98676.1 hypothetical protein ADP8_04199 [Roseomonas mucosa]UZO90872.1 hypothetical protein RMP42_04199 [Roseomonas mucosa]
MAKAKSIGNILTAMARISSGQHEKFALFGRNFLLILCCYAAFMRFT